MKRLLFSLAAIAGITLLALTGCSKSDSGGSTSAPAIDTAQIESVFKAVAAADRSEIDKAISAVKAGEYASALASLKVAAQGVKFTPEQQKAIKDLLAQVQAKLGTAANQATETAKKAGEDASKAVGDAAKAASDAATKAVGK